MKKLETQGHQLERKISCQEENNRPNQNETWRNPEGATSKVLWEDPKKKLEKKRGGLG